MTASVLRLPVIRVVMTALPALCTDMMMVRAPLPMQVGAVRMNLPSAQSESMIRAVLRLTKHRVGQPLLPDLLVLTYMMCPTLFPLVPLVKIREMMLPIRLRAATAY